MNNLLSHQRPSHAGLSWSGGSVVSCLTVPAVLEPGLPAFDEGYAEFIANKFSVSPPVQQLDGRILDVLMDWNQLSERVAEAETLLEEEQVQIDHSYIARAEAAAAQAPDIVLSKKDFQALTAIQTISQYSLDINDDEE